MPKYHGNQQQVLALNTFIKLMRCASIISAGVHCHLLGKLTVSQFGIMEALYHLGPMSQKALAMKILKSAGNITTIINNLAKNGLVTRAVSEDDKRYCTVQLTPKGLELIENIFPLHADIIVEHMAVLDENEQSTLGRLLKKLATANRQTTTGNNKGYLIRQKMTAEL